MVLAVVARRAGMFSGHYAPIMLANSVRANIPMRLLSTSSAALAVRKASTTGPGTAKAQLENTRTKRCERCGAAIPIVASPCPRCLDVTPLEHEHVVDSLTHHAVLGFTTPRPLADGESPAAADWAELAQVPGRGFEVDLDAIKRAKLQRLGELKPRKNHIEGPESATWRRLARNRIARAADILYDPAERAQYIVSPRLCPFLLHVADAPTGSNCQARKGADSRGGAETNQGPVLRTETANPQQARPLGSRGQDEGQSGSVAAIRRRSERPERD